MSINSTDARQIEFESPAARIIKQFDKGTDEFRIPTDLPDLTFLRALSIQGRLRYNQVSFSGGAGGSITIIPAVGETYFLYRVSATVSSGQSQLTVTNDGNLRSSNLMNITIQPSQIVNIIDSIVGNGIKSLVIALH